MLDARHWNTRRSTLECPTLDTLERSTLDTGMLDARHWNARRSTLERSTLDTGMLDTRRWILLQPIFILDSRISQLPLAIPMSTTNQTAGPSTDNFSAIFNVASAEYQRLTGKSLDTHPFAAQLDTCQNPEAVSNVLRSQAQAFSKFREGDERLMAWLDPTISILLTFSDTLGEGIGLVSTSFICTCCSRTSNSQAFSPAKTIFTGIGVLLGVCSSQALIDVRFA
jgi:hypothetical protein